MNPFEKTFPSGQLTTKKKIPKTSTLNHFNQAELKIVRLEVQKSLNLLFKNDIDSIPIPFTPDFKDKTLTLLREPKHYKNILFSVIDRVEKPFKINFDPTGPFEKQIIKLIISLKLKYRPTDFASLGAPHNYPFYLYFLLSVTKLALKTRKFKKPKQMGLNGKGKFIAIACSRSRDESFEYLKRMRQKELNNFDQKMNRIGQLKIKLKDKSYQAKVQNEQSRKIQEQLNKIVMASNQQENLHRNLMIESSEIKSHCQATMKVKQSCDAEIKNLMQQQKKINEILNDQTITIQQVNQLNQEIIQIKDENYTMRSNIQKIKETIHQNTNLTNQNIIQYQKCIRCIQEFYCCLQNGFKMSKDFNQQSKLQNLLQNFAQLFDFLDMLKNQLYLLAQQNLSLSQFNFAVIQNNSQLQNEIIQMVRGVNSDLKANHEQMSKRLEYITKQFGLIQINLNRLKIDNEKIKEDLRAEAEQFNQLKREIQQVLQQDLKLVQKNNEKLREMREQVQKLQSTTSQLKMRVEIKKQKNQIMSKQALEQMSKVAQKIQILSKKMEDEKARKYENDKREHKEFWRKCDKVGGTEFVIDDLIKHGFTKEDIEHSRQKKIN